MAMELKLTGLKGFVGEEEISQMTPLVQAAQVEAMVGKVNTGFPIFTAVHFPVSRALPPPTAKFMSAFYTLSSSVSCFTFS